MRQFPEVSNLQGNVVVLTKDVARVPRPSGPGCHEEARISFASVIALQAKPGIFNIFRRKNRRRDPPAVFLVKSHVFRRWQKRELFLVRNSWNHGQAPMAIVPLGRRGLTGLRASTGLRNVTGRSPGTELCPVTRLASRMQSSLENCCNSSKAVSGRTTISVRMPT